LPAATTCFDIRSPRLGDRDVISHFDWLSSMEMKIAPSVVWTAVSEELSSKATNASSLNAGALWSPAEAG
jgi:hypothetical protein